MKTNAIQKVYVIYKRSVYDKYVLEQKDKRLLALLKAKHPTTKNLIKNHDNHLRSLDHVEKILKKLGLKFTTVQRANIKNIQRYDLVVTIGGDGTFLRTSHHIKDQLLLGMNSSPQFSVGNFCTVVKENFEQKMIRLLSGDCDIRLLHRMRIAINGGTLPIEPINDLLYTSISPAATSRYMIKFNRKAEEHKSSGIWVSTAVGSTAAIKAAGGLKQTMGDDRLQFLTREPYQGIFNPYQLIQGFVNPKQKLTLVSKMLDSKLYLDGPTVCYSLEYGDKLEVSLSKNRLKMVG
ncbi:MAG: NAD(+)/NADH kinase [Deltaproteobacteria bacterium]|nr:NAD(+)/NADH kinase [Deltaproteobacteria bacterium]